MSYSLFFILQNILHIPTYLMQSMYSSLLTLSSSDSHHHLLPVRNHGPFKSLVIEVCKAFYPKSKTASAVSENTFWQYRTFELKSAIV